MTATGNLLAFAGILCCVGLLTLVRSLSGEPGRDAGSAVLAGIVLLFLAVILGAVAALRAAAP